MLPYVLSFLIAFCVADVYAGRSEGPHSLSSATPAVTILNGTVHGVYNAVHEQDHFLGLPYAQPPVGPLRFHPPQPISTSFHAPLNAISYGPFCKGYSLHLLGFDQNNFHYPQSEDCLTLNVVRPAGLRSDVLYPVMVWLHGGGFQEGGSGDLRYNMSRIVKTSVDMGSPTILVSINYRLSGWGFISGSVAQGEGALNIGLHDQRLALRWIQENIEAFGGDPARVTVFGESAGAVSIGHHIRAYGGRDDGLFRAAIAESGGPFNSLPFLSSTLQDDMYNAVLNATGCKDVIGSSLDCLRNADAEVLDPVFANKSWMPVIDGNLIPTYSSLSLKAGNFLKVPLLIGANTNEGTAFIGSGVKTSEEFLDDVISSATNRSPSNQTTNDLLRAYPSVPVGSESVKPSPGHPYGAQFGREASYTGDMMFIGTRRSTAEIWSNFSVPVYSYRFDTIPANILPDVYGVSHFSEVAFVFRNTLGLGYDSNPFDVQPPKKRTAYEEMADLMCRMWLSFANQQTPNAHGDISFDVEWPVYTAKKPVNLVFNAVNGSHLEPDDFRSEGIRVFWETALEFSR
ncbi:Carboxylesterase type B active site protein [Penicillium cf. viridicatum]|uniref:Carboxylic ester hydrolase n=1 Tax=Penicillium cf. viridicatum TaxID=2972119 RepID=A0A9W9N7P8_9EURO|nr:Carboxylesterase type B active site protein [Penicillium cf. viridicatum]